MKNDLQFYSGDSGSGFFVQNPGISQFTITGIVSASAQKDGKCDPDHYVIFTNVFKFINWIKIEIETETVALSSSGLPVWYSYQAEGKKIRPNTIFTQEVDSKAYVGRKMHDGKLLIGKFIPFRQIFYVPYHQVELEFADLSFDLLEINGGC